ncbi:MAG: O-antigen ligase family protein [Henriciella sp.]|nr:O-antigen ligase family protein [Henriciella sp.]
MLIFLQRNMLLGGLLVYLGLCLAFGGAGREGRYLHGVLQTIAAIGLFGLTVTWPERQKLLRLRVPISLVASMVLIALVQSIPLPSIVWQSIPGREEIVRNFASLELPIGVMPISLDVEATLSTIGYAFPPLFVLVLCNRVGGRRLKLVIPWVMSFAAVLSVVLGALQVFTGNNSSLYLYEATNKGLPVGTFANVNHFANFLLITLPFTIFVFRDLSKNWQTTDRSIATLFLAVATLLLLSIGIVAAGSLSVYLMSVPVLGLAFLFSRPEPESPVRLWVPAAIGLAIVATSAAIATSPVLFGLGALGNIDHHLSRPNMWATTWQAIQDHWLFGAGLGSYPSIIPLYEEPDTVTSTYLARAHNEYLQIFLEAGLLGIAVIGAAFVWLGQRALAIWRHEHKSSMIAFRKVALISIGVILLHSIIDFPARSPAIAAFLALFVGIISVADSRRDVTTEIVSTDPKRVVL